MTAAESGFWENPREVRSGAALLVLLALVAYLPAIQGGVLWDDRLLVTDNTCVRLADSGVAARR